MAYTNNNGQTRVGIRSGVLVAQTPSASTLWNSIYAVYNGDSVGSQSLKTSLVAAYNGDSNTNDSYGSNHGTAVGSVTYTTGKIGNAFQFAATNTHVNIPNTTDHLNFTGDFSISLWVNYNTTAASNEIFITNMKAGGTYGSGWVFQTDPSNLRFSINATSTQNSFGVPFTASTNTWYHFVVTRKRSTETKIYINGVLQSGTYSLNNPTVDPTYQAGQEYNIGAYILPQRYFSNIRIDALNIWSKELTQSEITELYNSGNGSQYITTDFYKPTTNDALNTYNGTAQGGLTYGVGKVGTAFQFNGTNAYVSLPNSSGQFNFTGDFSVSMWFRSSNLSASRYAIGNYKTGGSYGYGWILYYTGSGGFSFDLRNNNNINQVSKILSLATNTWYHVVAVRKMGQIHKLYVNGVDQFATQTDGNVSNIAGYLSNQPMDLGGLSNASAPALCDLDGVNMWTKALTQSEITELYNSGNGKQYPN